MNTKMNYCWIMTFSDEKVIEYDRAMLEVASRFPQLVPQSRPIPPKPPGSTSIMTTPYPIGPGHPAAVESNFAFFAADAEQLELSSEVKGKLAHVEIMVIQGGLQDAVGWINSEVGRVATEFASNISLAKLGNIG